MTREDAKATYKGWLVDKGEKRLLFLGDTYKLIDKIFDSIENKLCENCTFWDIEDDTLSINDPHWCDKQVTDGYVGSQTDRDFYCKHWEVKND